MRPLVKDQGITRVLLVHLDHLFVNFIIQMKEYFLANLGFEPLTSCSTVLNSDNCDQVTLNATKLLLYAIDPK